MMITRFIVKNIFNRKRRIYRAYLFVCLLFCGIKGFLAAQQWHKVHGPFTGKINTIVFTNDNIGLAGSDLKGMWRALPFTDDWQPANEGLEHLTVWSFTQNHNTWFAGTQYGGVYRSENEGALWLPSGQGLTSTDIRALLVTHSQTLLAGTVLGGLCRSTDNGINWFPATNGLPAPIILCLAKNHSNRLFAGTGGQGIFFSTDDGDTWIPANQGLTHPYVWSLTFRYGDLLAGTMGAGVFRSTNDGQSWTPAGLDHMFINALLITADSQYFAGTRGKGIFRSSNRGQTWQSLSFSDSIIWSLAERGDGKIFAGTSRLGIFSSSDQGDHWNPEGGASPRIIFFSSLNTNTPGSIYFVGAYTDGLFYSINQGSSWMTVPRPFRNMDVTGVTMDVSGKIFISGFPGSILRSENGPTGWVIINNGLPQVTVNSVIAVGNTLLAATHGKGIYRSSDQGNSWLPTSLDRYFVRKIFSHPFLGLFAATLGNGLFRSTDNGLHWFPAGTEIERFYIFDFISGPNGWLYIAADTSGVWTSSDGGQHWFPSRTGIEHRQFRALGYFEHYLYGGGKEQGVFYLDPNGWSWHSIPGSDSIRQIVSITVDPVLTVATEYDGLWRYTPPAAVNGNPSFNSRFSEIDAYPNPFNSAVQLRFKHHQSEIAQLTIYDALGRTLQKEQIHLRPGINQWSWNPAQKGTIASGLYIVRIQSSRILFTKKILFLK